MRVIFSETYIIKPMDGKTIQERISDIVSAELAVFRANSDIPQKKTTLKQELAVNTEGETVLTLTGYQRESWVDRYGVIFIVAFVVWILNHYLNLFDSLSFLLGSIFTSVISEYSRIRYREEKKQ